MSFKKTFSFIFVVVILGYLIWNILSKWDQVVQFRWSVNLINIAWLFIFLVPIYLTNAFSWHLITKSLGFNIPFKVNLKIWMLSNLSRFIPGGFWQYPSRVYLLKEQDISISNSAMAVFLEAIFNLSIGAVVTLLTILFWKLPFSDKSVIWLLAVFIILPFLIYFLTKPFLMNPLASVISRFSIKAHILRNFNLSMKWIFPISFTFFMQYFLAGGVLFFLTNATISFSVSTLPLFIGIYTISWLFGYLTLLAPGGLGVQEASVAFLLSFYMPFALASLIAIVFRVLLYISEIMTLGFVFLLSRKKDY